MDTLQEAIGELEAETRCRVVCGRAEETVRFPDLRGTCDVVVARGFGPPAATAECGAPLLQRGGTFVVSEPPEDRSRWDSDGLAMVGLHNGDRSIHRGFGFFSATQQELCADRFPRRVGVPNKRPLFVDK